MCTAAIPIVVRTRDDKRSSWRSFLIVEVAIADNPTEKKLIEKDGHSIGAVIGSGGLFVRKAFHDQ